MGEKELGSNQRFAADGLITEEQCQALINMNQVNFARYPLRDLMIITIL